MKKWFVAAGMILSLIFCGAAFAGPAVTGNGDIITQSNTQSVGNVTTGTIQGGSATIQSGAVKVDNKNTNTNLNSNVSVNNNTNNINSRITVDPKLTNKQNQQQGQGQSQSMINGQTISPSQSTQLSQTIEATKIPEGLGRDFAPVTPLPETVLVTPNAPVKNPKGFIPVAKLPKKMTLPQAQLMAKGAKVEVELFIKREWSVESIETTIQGGTLIGYVTGYGKTSASAFAAALVAAMAAGAESADLANSGMTVKPSAFFIGLGSAYTNSTLSGTAKDMGNTAGGSGVIGYSSGSQTTVFFYTYAIYSIK